MKSHGFELMPYRGDAVPSEKIEAVAKALEQFPVPRRGVPTFPSR